MCLTLLCAEDTHRVRGKPADVLERWTCKQAITQFACWRERCSQKNATGARSDFGCGVLGGFWKCLGFPSWEERRVRDTEGFGGSPTQIGNWAWLAWGMRSDSMWLEYDQKMKMVWEMQVFKGKWEDEVQTWFKSPFRQNSPMVAKRLWSKVQDRVDLS